MQQTLYYKKHDIVMSKIVADYEKETVEVENFTDNLLDRAFGKNEHPTFQDYQAFLEERCFPRNRDQMKLHLKELNLDFYDPYQIVRQTHGKLEGDFYSIEFEDEKEEEIEYEDGI